MKRKREDEVLKEKHNVLKMLIQERTNELAEANAELTKEIRQRSLLSRAGKPALMQREVCGRN